MLSLDAGFVQIYNIERGFGFVTSLHSNFAIRVFFHISRIKRKYPELLEHLEDGNYRNVVFWYDVEKTDKGISVKELWLTKEEVPEKHSNSFKDLEVTLQSYWINVNVEAPEWLDEITLLVIGQEARDILLQRRQQLMQEERSRQDGIKKRTEQRQLEVAERARVDTERARVDTERARVDAEQKRIVEITKWRNNPAGIRNEVALHHTCLQCDSKDVDKGKYGTNLKCRKCSTSWYINRCWSCKDERVDSRDPETPKCAVCTWYKCAFCSACHQNGCSTNRYSKAFKYVDDPSAMASSYYDQQRQDELRASAAEHGFDLDRDDISYDKEMGMFTDGDHWYEA